MAFSAIARQKLPRRSHRSSRRLVGTLAVSAVIAWSVAVMTAPSLSVGGPSHALAVSAHIIAMVLAFGSILLVDWHGFLWLIKKRQLAETIRLDGAASPLIWSAQRCVSQPGPQQSLDLSETGCGPGADAQRHHAYPAHAPPGGHATDNHVQ